MGQVDIPGILPCAFQNRAARSPRRSAGCLRRNRLLFLSAARRLLRLLAARAAVFEIAADSPQYNDYEYQNCSRHRPLSFCFPSRNPFRPRGLFSFSLLIIAQTGFRLQILFPHFAETCRKSQFHPPGKFLAPLLAILLSAWYLIHNLHSACLCITECRRMILFLLYNIIRRAPWLPTVHMSPPRITWKQFWY